MKALLWVMLALVLVAGTAVAGGDKNRGDKGKPIFYSLSENLGHLPHESGRNPGFGPICSANLWPPCCMFSAMDV